MLFSVQHSLFSSIRLLVSIHSHSRERAGGEFPSVQEWIHKVVTKIVHTYYVMMSWGSTKSEPSQSDLDVFGGSSEERSSIVRRGQILWDTSSLGCKGSDAMMLARRLWCRVYMFIHQSHHPLRRKDFLYLSQRCATRHHFCSAQSPSPKSTDASTIQHIKHTIDTMWARRDRKSCANVMCHGC